MDPTNSNPGASAPPGPQEDLGQTKYFPRVEQPEVPRPEQGAAPAAGYNGNPNAAHTPGQQQPQGQQPGYPPPYGQQGAPNGQPGHHYGPVQGGPWQWQ